jgi:hypothetical protein
LLCPGPVSGPEEGDWRLLPASMMWPETVAAPFRNAATDTVGFLPVTRSV